MPIKESDSYNGVNDLKEKVAAIENRVTELEKELMSVKSGVPAHSGRAEDYEDMNLSFDLLKFGGGGGVESKIGEYGLSWLGNIVLFFGLVFLMHYVTNIGHPGIAGTIGLISVTCILLMTRYVRRSFSYMAFIFTISAHILLFYTVVRLYFFTNPQVISNKTLVLMLLMLITGFEYFESVRRRSEGYSIMALLLLLVLSVLSDQTHVMLSLLMVSAAISMYLFYRYGWYRLLLFSNILGYIVFFLWMINNPLMGHPVQCVANHQYAYLYLAFCGAIYSLITLIRQKGDFPDNIILTMIILNGLGFSSILGLMVVNFFPANYIWIFTSISLFCLLFSGMLKYFSTWKFSPALYAVYGFVAISITFYGIWNFPKAYLFLSLQSFLVVSMALWFRSRIIIVMNLFLFLFLMAGYTGMNNLQTFTNFSFPVVAFLSARIINWQRERLNIKTDLIRNIYLVVLFFTMLFALYKAVPGQYVTLSWTFVVLFYFLMSIILRNVKYRYLAISTMIAAAIYLFAVDLARIGIVYRIAAFMFLAIISIGISTYYVRKLKKKQAESQL